MFLVEKDTALEHSLVMDAQRDSMGEHTMQHGHNGQQTLAKQVPSNKSVGASVDEHGLRTPAASPGTYVLEPSTGTVKAYLEMHDYAIDTTFRGFVAEKQDERTMFVFFGQSTVNQDLKSGYVRRC